MPIITIAILYPNLQFQEPLEIRYYNLNMNEKQVDYRFYTCNRGIKTERDGGRDEKLNLIP